MSKPIEVNKFNLFTQGKITFEEMTDSEPKHRPAFTKEDAATRKKSRRDEDNIQSAAIAYLNENYSDIPIYGNATANIFNSGGLYRKALPKTAYGQLSALGIPAKTWGTLLDHALGKLGIRLTVGALEKDQEGAKFAQMKRTKNLGAVKSWPDIQVCFPNFDCEVMSEDGRMHKAPFHGLFMEVKKPDASSLPWGKDSVGKFTTNDHLQEQATMLCRLTNHGYLAVFCIGYDEFQAVVEIYLRGECASHYLQLQKVTFKDGTSMHLYRLRKRQ